MVLQLQRKARQEEPNCWDIFRVNSHGSNSIYACIIGKWDPSTMHTRRKFISYEILVCWHRKTSMVQWVKK